MNNKKKYQESAAGNSWVTRPKLLPCLPLFPSHVVSGLGYKAPSDKLNIAAIGIGGMGRNQPECT